MKKVIKKSVHDVASLLVRTKAPAIAKERHESIVEGIDQKIERLKKDRKEKAFAFLESRK